MPAETTWTRPHVEFSFLVSSTCAALQLPWPCASSLGLLSLGLGWDCDLVIMWPPPYWNLSSKSSPQRGP